MTTRIEREHMVMVSKLAKPGLEIIQQLDPRKAHLWHMASALQGEAGELFDAIKKNVIYNKPSIDRENVLEELGDIEFYLEGIRAHFGFLRDEVLEANIKKLSKRYASGSYSNEAAQSREDKK